MTDSILRSYFHMSTTTFVPFALTVPGLLEDFPGSTAAYSLRKLSGSATNAVRIRRSSDNAEQDFGFSGNDFAAASAASFIGGGSGFVTTWYDQSGNGRHMTQTTAANQPSYLASGIDSKPCLDFIPANSTYMEATGALSVFLSSTIGYHVTVARWDAFSTTDVIALWTDANIGDMNLNFFDTGATKEILFNLFDGGNQNAIVTGLATGTDYLVECVLTDPTMRACVNAGTDGTDTYTAAGIDMTKTPLRIGRFPAPNVYFDGKIAEMIWWSSNPSRAGVQSNINTYYTIY